MIFLTAFILFVLIGICHVLNRIHEDIRSIRNWYCEDQK